MNEPPNCPNHQFPRGNRTHWEISQGFIDRTVAGPSYLESREVLDAIIAAIPPHGLFIEIGSWTAATAALIADARPQATIVTVDNFGRWWQPEAEYSRWLLAGVNVLSRPNLVQIVADSAQAYRLLQPEQADVILVDGDHEEASCYADLCRAAQLLKRPEGQLLAHDYGVQALPGVTAAVDRFCLAYNHRVGRQVASLAFLSPH